jgi:uncharacterized protein (TIGR00106 family)
MSAMAYVSITPLGEGESVSEYVAKAVKVIRESGLDWQLTPMGTIIEGDRLEDVLAVVTQAAETLSECSRLSISVKVDYRRNRAKGLEQKVNSVMEKL